MSPLKNFFIAMSRPRSPQVLSITLSHWEMTHQSSKASAIVKTLISITSTLIPDSDCGPQLTHLTRNVLHSSTLSPDE